MVQSDGRGLFFFFFTPPERLLSKYMKYIKSVKIVNHQFMLWIGLVFAAIICLWAILASTLIPHLITEAYQGKSLFRFLNNYFANHSQSLETILSRWHENTNGGLAVFFFSGLIALVIIHPSFYRIYVKEATPDSLGIIRIIVCGVLLIQSLSFNLVKLNIPIFPKEVRTPMGMMRIIYALPLGFEKVVESQSLLQIFCLITAIILFLGMIGYQTKWVLPLGAILWFIQAGVVRQYSVYSHTGIMPLYLLTVLCFTPCGDGLSLDRLQKIKRGQSVPMSDIALPIYGWSRYLCWTIMAVVYTLAGINKIRFGGWFWWNAVNLRGIIYHGTLEDKIDSIFAWDIPSFLINAPDGFYAFLGIAGIILEIAYLSVLFLPQARLIVPILALLFHISVIFFQKIIFFDLIILQLIFFDFTKLSQKIQNWKINIKTEPPTNPSFQKIKPKLFYPLLSVAAVTILLLPWAFRMECYPFSTWQMYAHPNNSGNITYYRTLMHDESGKVSRMNFRDLLGNANYRIHAQKCFQPRRIKICEKVLALAASTYQQKNISNHKFKQFEIQKRRWDFKANPQDSQRGEIVAGFIYPQPTEFKN